MEREDIRDAAMATEREAPVAARMDCIGGRRANIIIVGVVWAELWASLRGEEGWTC